ncbi:MAG TPA: LON peptidase substrate-binding domain-containing protein [Gemmataceae bacterium]|nr:LON peptidase substrate-binding domain-containing protein [Gemmataceae bacterium]
MTSEDFAALTTFSGTVRLFPLPNLVLFPGVVQGLHIFEPRYRQMMADALQADRLITLVLLQPGWEPEYPGNPPIYPIACLGRIADVDQLPDGRYNLQLRGLIRVRLNEEITPASSGKLYRQAQATLLPDADPVPTSAQRQLRKHLTHALPAWRLEEGVFSTLRRLLQSAVSFGNVVDIVSFVLPLPLELKQQLLQTTDVEERAARLLAHLEQDQPLEAPEWGERKFPPDFSVN